jgi:hypothetical protein
MRALLVVAAVAIGGSAAADPLPSGAIGIVTGAISGTGADAKRIGAGYYQFGAQASWQPTTTERRWGWTVRWAALFGVLYGGSASQVEPSLRTVQLDLTLGIRVRPWSTPSRYLTFRGGGELLRSNEPIMTSSTMPGQRAFYGAIASIGLDQYAGGFMFDIDVRYGLIGGGGPQSLALLLGIAFTGP